MKYEGMTVNERLYSSGLIDDYDEAVEDKDTDKIKPILNKVGLTGNSVPPILKSIGLLTDDNLSEE